MTENETNRYANSKVYKLCDDEGYYYYGSTCMPLHKRLYDHKRRSKEVQNRKVYIIFTNERFIANEIKIILVEEFSLKSKEELLREENKYIEQSLNDQKCLNSLRAVENYEITLEKERAHKKLLYEANKDKLCERIKSYQKSHVEEIKAQKREYNLANMENIKARKKGMVGRK